MCLCKIIYYSASPPPPPPHPFMCLRRRAGLYREAGECGHQGVGADRRQGGDGYQHRRGLQPGAAQGVHEAGGGQRSHHARPAHSRQHFQERDRRESARERERNRETEALSFILCFFLLPIRNCCHGPTATCLHCSPISTHPSIHPIVDFYPCIVLLRISCTNSCIIEK